MRPVWVVVVAALYMVSMAAAAPGSAPGCLSGEWVSVNTGFEFGVASVAVDGASVLVQAKTGTGQPWTNGTGTLLNTTAFEVKIKGVGQGTAVANADCTALSFTFGWTWRRGDATVTSVHVVTMTHLDVGFTNLKANVCATYFDEFFPAAINTSRTLRAEGSEARFVWTEFSWLIQEYLDATAGCTGNVTRSRAAIELLEAAIADGDVIWNAMPFSYFVELADPALFTYGLSLAPALNHRFNKSHGVVAGKHTDVPGMSRSAIPLLAASGVQAMHIGYNGACLKPAAVPPVFVWRHPETDTEVLMMVESGYGFQVRVGSAVLAFLYMVDNTGPPTAAAVKDFWATQRVAFPAATIAATSLDEFARVALAQRHTLPVITQEIGDSWLYGAPADPFKVSKFREVRRAVATVPTSADNPLVSAYNARLLLCIEHNWGLSVGQYLPSLRAPGNWTNAEFHRLRPTAPYQLLEAGWAEARSFLTPQPTGAAWQAASARHRREWLQVHAAVDAVLRRPPPPLAPRGLHHAASPLPLHGTCGNMTYAIGATGSIDALSVGVGGGARHTWADAAVNATLGAFAYETFTLDDFNVFNEQYNPGCGPPCGDFSKAGMDSAKPQHLVFHPNATLLAATPDGCNVTLQLVVDAVAHTKYGAPADMQLVYVFHDGGVNATLSWQRKTTTRLVEAMWMGFNPLVGNASHWRMDVLGHDVSPMDVVVNGTRHLHAVWDGVSNVDPTSGEAVWLHSLDAPLAAPGDNQHLLRYEGWTQPDLSQGWYFNLMNNAWGTAFPQWYGDDAEFRFQVRLQPPATVEPDA